VFWETAVITEVVEILDEFRAGKADELKNIVQIFGTGEKVADVVLDSEVAGYVTAVDRIVNVRQGDEDLECVETVCRRTILNLPIENE
jgi:hypothetical protein